MYSVSKPGYDLATMRAVTMAYRRERQAGRLDEPAREAAIAAFRARHPKLERLPASAAARAARFLSRASMGREIAFKSPGIWGMSVLCSNRRPCNVRGIQANDYRPMPDVARRAMYG